MASGRDVNATRHTIRVRLVSFVTIALALSIAALVFVEPARIGLEQRLQAVWLAADSRLRPLTPVPITLVGIDEASIDELGPWPWPRATWAKLLDRLRTRHDPALIALDAVFPAAPDQAQGNAAFARALAQSPTVIGQLLLDEPGERGAPQWARVLPPGAPVRVEPEPSARWVRYSGVLGSQSGLAAAAEVGHINAAIDPDGVMRRVPTLLCTKRGNSECSQSFLQATIASLTGATNWRLVRGRWNEAQWLLQPGELTSLALPLDQDFMLTIPWRHPAGLRYVSARDVWQNRLEEGALDHQIVIFGGVSIGLSDVVTSTLYNTVPGMEVHAQLLRNWLTDTLPHEPRYAPILMLGWTVVLALLLAANARHVGRLALVTAIGAFVPLAGAAFAWYRWHAMWPAAAPALFLAMAGTILMMSQTLHNRAHLVHRFEAYLPAPLRRLLGRTDDAVPTETGWGTVMVTDILGYTVQSQSLSLTQLAHWGDSGIDHVVRHARAHGAMLDNVAGDGALLLWRTGTDMEQASAAAAAAKAILEGLDDLNSRLALAGLPPIAMGIGIHAGPYLLGSFGTDQKRYTVVSQVANFAAHIERQTRRHPWPVLISKTVAQALPPLDTRAVAELDLGRGRTMQLYTLARCAANHWPDDVRRAVPTTTTTTTTADQ